MNRRVSIGLVCALAGTAATLDPGGVFAQSGRTVQHSLGFTIEVGDLAKVDVTDAGFRILPEGVADVRSPPTIDVLFHVEALPGPLAESRRVDGRTVDYDIEAVTVGSGGTEYTLTVRLPMCGSVFELRHHEQCEFCGEPDFAAGWAIVASAACEQDGG